MKMLIDRANRFFEKTLSVRSRGLVFLAALLLIPALLLPLWKMSLYSNQFPDGLFMQIFAYKLEGGQSELRDDLKEINSLNHYIGMAPLREEDFTEFKWIPFVLGAIVLLCLRALVMGKMAKLVDVFVLMTYFGLFSIWSFYRKLYLYGHNLDPTAAVTVEPFTPPLFGHQKTANFDIYNYPDIGTYFLAAVPLILLLAMYFSARSGKPTGKP